MTGSYNNSTTSNLTGQATYSSGNPTVASVNSGGRVVALKSGSAVITASYANMTAQVAVTVDIVTLTSITVDPSNLNFAAIGQPQQLTVTAHYSDNTSKTINSGVSFTSGDSNVASVSISGLVSSVGNGLTQITAYLPGLQPVSVPVAVNTANDTVPQVQILSPTSGSTVQRGEIVSVSVRATDAVGGVSRVLLTVRDSGNQIIFTETRQISPASLDVTTSISFIVPNNITIGSSINVTAGAQDTGNQSAVPVTVSLSVADKTAPSVTITAPASQTRYNYGDTVDVTITASDLVGVTSIRYATTGGVTVSGSQQIIPASLSAATAFSFEIPFGFSNPDVRILAFATDVFGNEGAAIPIDVTVTSADIIAPQTHVTAVAPPGSNPATIVTYQIDSGLSDLDHVELYFRRNGIGTFNRYTDSDNGNPEGTFVPQAGNTGTILFNSTKMGGDGNYEFYSIGVDKAGNREVVPMSVPVLPTDYSGLLSYYPFNGNAMDNTGSSNHGSLQGGAFTIDRFGQETSALSLNGSGDYVGIGAPVPASLQIQNEVTLAAWIFVTQYPVSNTLGTIVGCQYDPDGFRICHPPRRKNEP